MLTIQVGNYFSDKFVPPCYVSYFINTDGRKLMFEYICRTFYIFNELNFIFLSFNNLFITELYIETQSDYLT